MFYFINAPISNANDLVEVVEITENHFYNQISYTQIFIFWVCLIIDT